MDLERLEYLCYRCTRCHTLLTKIEIIERWEEAERTETSTIGICVCGGRQISPGNPTLKEQAELGGWWQWVRYSLLRRDDADTRLWKLWYHCVKGKSLGENYPTMAGDSGRTAN